jgi:hypothetical protein
MGSIKWIVLLSLIFIAPPLCTAQCPSSPGVCGQGVPHFVKFSGVLKSVQPISQVEIVAVKFVVYDDSRGGTALWQEVQNIRLDMDGRYEVVLGATGTVGVPLDLFTSGDQRWLGVQLLRPGVEEEPRILLVSVPYALEAANAQTLGGLPASEFARVSSPTSASVDTVPVTSASRIPAESVISDLAPTQSTAQNSAVATTLNDIPKFSASGALVNSQITDANGTVSIQNLSNILFADRFSGGVPDAVAACPASGCVIYALSQNTNRNLGTIDPGTKAISIYLGPYVYTVKQITLRKALKIIGMGASGGKTGSPTCSLALPCNGTTLQSNNANNPVFVIPQTNNTPATNVLLSGFRVLGSAGNVSEDGFFLDTSATVNTGLWYSSFDDIYMEGFSGNAIHIQGRSNDFVSGTQWILFNNVIVSRSAGGGNGLRVEGASFELRFRNCEFDGQGAGDGTNIYIGGRAGGASGYPISIAFEGLVSQSAGTAVQINGAYNITFYASHHEILWGGYQIIDTYGIGDRGITITDSYFAGNVGSNSGSGFELSIGTTLAVGIIFTHNQFYGNPDAIVKGTNLASVAYQDNLYFPSTLTLPPTSGLTPQISPATSINIVGVHSVGLNPSSTPITTIQSSLGPGEMVTFFTLGGPVTFSAGGNIDLMGASSVTINGTMTFVRVDLGGLLWKPVSQYRAPSVFAKSIRPQDELSATLGLPGR